MYVFKWLTRFKKTWENFKDLHNKTIRNRYFMLRDGRSKIRVFMINFKLAAYLG